MANNLINQQNVISKMWNIPQNAITQISSCMKVYSSTHGMFAGVPIVCKADKCAYIDICLVDPANRINGTRCPMEAAAVISRFEFWCKHFGIDVTKENLKHEDAVDAMLIRDLVDNEVQMLRADNRIALSGDFLGKTIANVDNKGREHLEDTITPAEEFKFKLQEKRYKILQLLNSTRKDKANQITGDQPSTKAATLLNKVNNLIDQDELDNVEIIETDYENVEEEQNTNEEVENQIDYDELNKEFEDFEL